MNTPILPAPARRRRRVAAALAAATALVALADPALAATESPAPEMIEMTLADGGVVTDGSVHASFTVAGGDDDIVVTRGEALASGREVREWLEGSGSAKTTIATIDVDRGAHSATTDLPFERTTAGVYPIAASWGSSEQRGVVYVPADDQAGIALVVPVTAPSTSRGILSADELTTLTAEDGELTQVLDAVEGTAAILAIDPAIPAAIRALGAAAPASASEWLDRLVSLPNDRFALQYGDADVSSQIDAGLDAPIAPAHLGNFLDESVTQATLSSLLDIGESGPKLFWPRPGSADDAVVEALTDPGDARVLVPASSTTSHEPALGAAVLAYDDTLAGDLLAASADEIDVARAEAWLAEIEAEGPLLVAFDRGETPRLEAALDAASFAGQKPVTLDEVLAAGRGSVDLIDADPDSPRIDAIHAYLDDREGLATISTALKNPAAFLGETTAEVQQLLSVSWSDDDSEWTERASALSDLNDDRAHAIEIQEQQPIQLLSGSAPLPVWIRNDLPYPAEVTIVAIADDPRLIIEKRTVVTAQPDSVTRAQVDVKSRVGSGKVTVHYSLESAAGTQIGPARASDVTVRASWERTGLGVLTVVVVVCLVIGGVRQVRKRRR